MMHDRVPAPRNCDRTIFGARGPWDAAIVIPAKDEADRIHDCVIAAAVSVNAAKPRITGIIVVVNNSSDGTARIVADTAIEQNLDLVLLDCTFKRADAGVGSARRLGLDLGCDLTKVDGILLTTDADTVVRSDWIMQNFAELGHADLICGSVLGLPEEARALPREIAAHGSAEWDYVTASIALAAALDPRGHDPGPAHHNAAGASLAVTRSAYLNVGGLPILQMGEDRAFAERMEAHDLRVRYSDRAVVETSCRMIGRTEGGMAGALRARAFEIDPLADEWLEPANDFARRHALRGKVRSAWPHRGALTRVLEQYSGNAASARALTRHLPEHCGAFLALVEGAGPPRQRLRLSDCRMELALLQQHLHAATNAVRHAGMRTSQRASPGTLARG